MSVQLSRTLIFLAVPLGFGSLALLLGMDANWDLRNYHYYNAWAFLQNRYDLDFLVAQIPTFYNPIPDIPYYFLTQNMPAANVAFVLGVAAGLNVILLTLLGEELLLITHPGKKLAMATFLALAGCCGAISLSEVGTVFYDNILSLGLISSLLLLVKHWQALAQSKPAQAVGLGLLAGLPVGFSFGLKQSTVMFPVALCLGLLFTLESRWPRRFLASFTFGLGVLAGMLAGGGYWLWHLWQAYGNPTFPYFNQIFQSPWGLPQDYRDTQYLPHDFWQRLIFPFTFTLNSRATGEIDFRDLRILLAYILIPFAGFCRFWRPTPYGQDFTRQGPAMLVMLGASIAYLLWLKMFAIYRYILSLEMLAPLLVALAIDRLPIQRARKLALAIALAMLALVTTEPGHWIRVPFSNRAVEVNSPGFSDAAHTIVVLAGHEPLSFLLPSLPAESRFLRIDSTFTNPDETSLRFNKVMAEIIGSHTGPLLTLFINSERPDVVRRLLAYNLTIAEKPCEQLTSPIGAAPYELCPLSRVLTQ